MLSCFRLNITFLLIFLTSILAVGNTYAGVVIHVPGDYPTIQAGIDAAANGDTVRVAPGTYTGNGNRNIQFHDKSIVLESAAGANATTIDCEGALRGLFISNEEIVGPGGIPGQDIPDRSAGVDNELVIDGFTITNGAAWAGAGIVVSNGNHPIIKNCRINNCTAGFAGGGIFVGDRAFPSFINCVINENAAVRGGGVRVGDDVQSTFIDCTISENTATRGGGVDITDQATTVFKNCNVSGNQATDGGGVAVSNLSVPTLEDCTITGNQADNGGGLKILDDSAPDITGCTIASNYALHDGGGLFVVGASIEVTRTIVWGNCAGDSGDQVYVSDGETVSFACSDVDSVGVAGAGQVFYDVTTIFVDPLFCQAFLCTNAPTAAGTYTLDNDSQALAAASPCGELIGAQPQGCTERSFDVGDDGQFAKIQDAIDQTVGGVGDVVVVASGLWDGPRNTELDFGGKNIMLKADGPAVIDGGGTVRAIVFKNGEDYTAEVQGFTLTGGDPTKPGSAVFVSGASPTFTECVIKDNNSDAGVVCVESGTPIFKYCTIEENASSSMNGVLDFVGGSPRLMSSVVRNNSATNAVTISTPTQVWQSEITDNSGCGVYMDATTTSLVIGSDISRNGDRGVVINEGSATFADVTFRQNAGGGVVVTGLGSGGGPAPSSDNGDLPQAVGGAADFSSCEFSGHSTDRGAGFFFDCTNEPEVAYTVTFADCRFTGNHATFEGGAVAICGRATNADIIPVFTACTITANSARDGGGIYMGVEEVGLGRSARAQVDQTILWGNCSTVSPEGEAFVLEDNEVEINCSHAGIDEIGGGGLIAATDVTSGVPAFCDYPGSYYSAVCNPNPTTQGDYSLSPGSPAAPDNHPCGPDQIGAFPVGFCSPTGIGDRVPQMQTTLRPPAPNPFNPTTTVEFVLDVKSHVRLRIFDVQGSLVRTLVDREMTVGVHRPEWDGRDGSGKAAASGVYFVRFEAGQTVQTQKLVLVK